MADPMTPRVVTDPKHNVAARDALIQDGFAERFKLEQKLAELMETHIQTTKDAIKSLNRKIKKDTDIDGEDLTLWYKIYARQQAAKLLEEKDRDRILDNLQATYEAIGGQLDFVDAIEAIARDDDDQPSVAVLEKARKAGRAAGENGEDGKSTYPHGSASDTAWMQGWTDAQTSAALSMGAGKTDATAQTTAA